jgi:hypothetical protein
MNTYGKSVIAGLLFCAVGIAAPVHAAPVAGVAAQTDAGVFSVYSNGGSAGPGGAEFHGGEGFVSSHAFFSHQNGTAESDSTLPSSTMLAELKVKAILSGSFPASGAFGTIVGGTAGGTAVASQKFKYIGAVNHTETINYVLDYAAVLNGDPLDFIFAEVGALSDVDYFYSQDIGSITGESGGMLLTSNGGMDDAIDSFLTNTGNGTPQSVNLSISFDLSPGQEFFLHSRIIVGASLGTNFVDAYNTLTGEFTNPSLFQNIGGGVAPIPSPAAGSMLALGAAALLLTRRSRRA